MLAQHLRHNRQGNILQAVAGGLTDRPARRRGNRRLVPGDGGSRWRQKLGVRLRRQFFQKVFGQKDTFD